MNLQPCVKSEHPHFCREKKSLTTALFISIVVQVKSDDTIAAEKENYQNVYFSCLIHYSNLRNKT